MTCHGRRWWVCLARWRNIVQNLAASCQAPPAKGFHNNGGAAMIVSALHKEHATSGRDGARNMEKKHWGWPQDMDDDACDGAAPPFMSQYMSCKY